MEPLSSKSALVVYIVLAVLAALLAPSHHSAIRGHLPHPLEVFTDSFFRKDDQGPPVSNLDHETRPSASDRTVRD